MPPQKSQLDFLSLPLKARLRIYEYVLVSEPQVIPHCKLAADPLITPSVLRTCKQIHSEASPILHSKNTFLVAEPERNLKWFKRMGRSNIKHLKRIRIFVHPVYYTEEIPYLCTAPESSFWYKVLDQLAQEAMGLRDLYIYWDAEETWVHYGAGRDLRFVRELAKIQRLQSMGINVFYGIHWPRYLAEKTGVPIQEEDHTQPFLQCLRKYQQGTENLVP